ncbi:MAG: sigma-70 family RNA polymerase sigma factor [Evtepia sp.]
MNVQTIQDSITDEDLCAFAIAGDRSAEEALVLRYSRLVRICARPFFLIGGDSEDLIQEGMFGLLTAVREFRADRFVSFRTFAEVCVRRRMISAVRMAARHSPLNSCVSLSLFVANRDSQALGMAFDRQENPEDLIIQQENLTILRRKIQKELSDFETQILGFYLNGLSYSEIAKEVQRSTKSVDNAVQRIRHKAARQIQSGEYSES